MANLKDLLVNGSTNHVGRNYSQTPALGTKDRQVATTEFVLDNCYKPPLLSFMWADHLLNDMSWLRADTFSWQDGTTYSSAYNELLSEYNNSASVEETEGSITFKRTPKGYKIALATQENAILNLYNTTGIAWYYILDTTNQRFKLPRTKFGFEGLRTNVGDDIEAGLPNNGNSDTVQPPATQMYLYFYVGEFARNSVQQTAGLNSELFNGKLDINGSNLNAQGKSYFSGLGMPSGEYIDLTLGASGSTYTAPANGWFCFYTIKSTAGYNYLENTKTSFKVESRTTTNNTGCGCYIPARKNDVIRCNYDGVNSKPLWRFYYAEGEPSS